MEYVYSSSVCTLPTATFYAFRMYCSAASGTLYLLLNDFAAYKRYYLQRSEV
jgi:hypothetical protein